MLTSASLCVCSKKTKDHQRLKTIIVASTFNNAVQASKKINRQRLTIQHTKQSSCDLQRLTLLRTHQSFKYHHAKKDFSASER